MANRPENGGCLGFIFNIFKTQPTEDNSTVNELEYRYVKTEQLLSLAELSFYHVLNQVFLEGYTVFSKVRLADLISVKGAKWRTGFGKISSKHVDYVIVESATSKILLIIELDDSSHNTKQAQKSDEIKNQSLNEAGIPLLRD